MRRSHSSVALNLRNPLNLVKSKSEAVIPPMGKGNKPEMVSPINSDDEDEEDEIHEHEDEDDDNYEVPLPILLFLVLYDTLHQQGC